MGNVTDFYPNIAADCDPGHSLNDANGECSPCGAGTFSLGVQATSCTTCEANKYSVEESDSCTACPTGKFVAAGAGTSAAACLWRKFLSFNDHKFAL